MKTQSKVAVAILLSIASSLAMAQAPGWNVTWGPQAVPLSPALTGLMALALAAAAYAFLRKRAAHGALSVLVAGVIGVLGVHDDLLALPSLDLDIGSPKGSQFLTCSGETLYIGTTTITAGVRIAQVQSSNIGSEPLTNSIANQCAPGVLVTPSQTCQLPCPAEEPPEEPLG